MATLRFVVVPKVVHPWFEEVNKGAQAQAAILSRELRDSIVVDYRPPAVAGVAEQNAIREAAIKKLDRVGMVRVVSMDGIEPVLDAIKEGVIDSSSATIPRMQGSKSVLMLWQASLGVPLPQTIDTGIEVMTRGNVDAYLAKAGGQTN